MDNIHRLSSGDLCRVIKESSAERLITESLLSKVSLVEILGEAVFEDYHRELLPMALLLKRKKLKQSANNQRENTLKDNRRQNNWRQSRPNQVELAPKSHQGDIEGLKFEQAVQKLRSEPPKTTFKESSTTT